LNHALPAYDSGFLRVIQNIAIDIDRQLLPKAALVRSARRSSAPARFRGPSCNLNSLFGREQFSASGAPDSSRLALLLCVVVHSRPAPRNAPHPRP
jgi:hypothetical protein